MSSVRWAQVPAASLADLPSWGSERIEVLEVDGDGSGSVFRLLRLRADCLLYRCVYFTLLFLADQVNSPFGLKYQTLCTFSMSHDAKQQTLDVLGILKAPILKSRWPASRFCPGMLLRCCGASALRGFGEGKLC